MASPDPSTALAQAARDAFTASQLLDASERHLALIAVKDALTQAKQEILDANKLDIQVSTRTPLCRQFRGLPEAD